MRGDRAFERNRLQLRGTAAGRWRAATRVVRERGSNLARQPVGRRSNGFPQKDRQRLRHTHARTTLSGALLVTGTQLANVARTAH